MGPLVAAEGRLTVAHTSTAWGDVLTAIVAGLRALPGYRSPSGTDGAAIPVYDSAEWLLTEDNPATLVVVGDVGDADQLTVAGQAPQRVATLGTSRRREEEGTVNCYIASSSGDFGPGAVPAVREVVLGVLDDVDGWLRANPDLDLVPAYQHVEATMQGLPSIRPIPTSDGPVFEVDLTIGYTARI